MRVSGTGPPRAQGLFLLEALVALLVFAIGTVGLLGVIANALRESGNARWRTEAFGLASSTLSSMWAEDPEAIAARYDATTSGAGYRTLLAAAMRLPGVRALANAPVVTIEDAGGDRRRVSVTVYWQLPTEGAAHRASVVGVVPGR